jgi:hypothetical protein
MRMGRLVIKLISRTVLLKITANVHVSFRYMHTCNLTTAQHGVYISSEKPLRSEKP